MKPTPTLSPVHTTRRRFIALVPLAGTALLAACSKKEDAAAAAPAPAPAPAPSPAPDAAPAPMAAPPAQAPASKAMAPAPAPASAPVAAAGGMLDEKDATAQSLGYVSDATRADKAKFPAYAPGLACGNCAVFGGKAGDANGPCPIFQGRQVSAKGWCSAHVKKTG